MDWPLDNQSMQRQQLLWIGYNNVNVGRIDGRIIPNISIKMWWKNYRYRKENLELV